MNDLDQAPPRCEALGAHILTGRSRHCVSCGTHIGPCDQLDCPECREEYLPVLPAGTDL